MWNVNRGKGVKAKGLADFMLFRETEESKKSLDELLIARL